MRCVRRAGKPSGEDEPEGPDDRAGDRVDRRHVHRGRTLTEAKDERVAQRRHTPTNKARHSIVCDYREQLAQTLEDSAKWRSRKAEECLDRKRNDQSACALCAAARDVAALPDDDPRLLRLIRLYETDDDDAVGNFLEEEHYIIARHGFDSDATQTTDVLLSALLKAADDAVLSSLDDQLQLQDDQMRGYGHDL